MIRRISIGIALGALGLASQTARAVSILTLSESGFSTLMIFDNGPGDLSPASGSIVFAGSYGHYSFESDTGNTKPAIGSPSNPFLTIANTTVTAAAGASPLTVTFTETGFDPGTYTFSSDVNGTLAAHKVAFSTYANGTLLSTFTGGPGAFDSGTMSAVFTSAASVMLTLQATISHPAAGLTLFDANLIGRKHRTPDGGSTAALLGLGFLGLGCGFRKRVMNC